MDKNKEKLTFSKIEILFMVVMVALVIVAGITVFSLTTRNQNISNFKKDAASLISATKNAYAGFTLSGKTSNIVTSTDGTHKGMCITIKGLEANDFLVKEYEGWDAYIVVEETSTKQHKYTIWATNGKYVIDGYESNEISDISLKDGIKADNNDSFTSKVKTSFTGTSSEKGGTGSSDGKVLKRYETACITEKVE